MCMFLNPPQSIFPPAFRYYNYYKQAKTALIKWKKKTHLFGLIESFRKYNFVMRSIT